MLAREKDFAAACGSEVKLKTRRPLDGRRRFRGLLVGFDEGHARVEVDGEEVRIAFEVLDHEYRRAAGVRRLGEAQENARETVRMA